jgi:predicted amidophosphoribosyltransferase
VQVLVGERRGANADEAADFVMSVSQYQGEVLVKQLGPLAMVIVLAQHTYLDHGERLNSLVGNVVHSAKSYDRTSSPGSKSAASVLAALMASFIHRHRSLASVDVLVAVPPSNMEKTFDLPSHIVHEISRWTGIARATPGALTKVRQTRPVKGLSAPEKARAGLESAFEASPELVGGRDVLLIDDIVESGITLTNVGRALERAGARQVYAMVATRTRDFR